MRTPRQELRILRKHLFDAMQADRRLRDMMVEQGDFEMELHAKLRQVDSLIFDAWLKTFDDDLLNYVISIALDGQKGS